MKKLAIWLIVLLFAAIGSLQDFQLFPPCQTEDSTMCYWNAHTRSNGQGVSFIALWDTETYIYIP